MLTPDILQTTVAFLSRATLQGGEAEQFMACVNALRSEYDQITTQGVPAAWQALADCIRSGQVPEQDVPNVLDRDPSFAAWYRSTIQPSV